MDNYDPTLIQGLLDDEMSGIERSICLDCDMSAVMLLKVKQLLAEVAHTAVKTANPCNLHLVRRTEGKGW